MSATESRPKIQSPASATSCQPGGNTSEPKSMVTWQVKEPRTQQYNPVCFKLECSVSGSGHHPKELAKQSTAAVRTPQTTALKKLKCRDSASHLLLRLTLQLWEMKAPMWSTWVLTKCKLPVSLERC